jgi:hypothetical protein
VTVPNALPSQRPDPVGPVAESEPFRPGYVTRLLARRRVARARRKASRAFYRALHAEIRAEVKRLNQRAREVERCAATMPPADLSGLPNPEARHDVRAHLDANDLAVTTAAAGCPACVIRPGA